MTKDFIHRVREGGLPDPKIKWPRMYFEAGGSAASDSGSAPSGGGSDAGDASAPAGDSSASDTGVSDASAATGIAGIGASDAAAATGASSSVGVGGVGGDVGGLGGVSIGAGGSSSPTGQAAGNGVTLGQIAALAAAVMSANPAAIGMAVANIAGQVGVANAIGIAGNVASGNIAGAISGIANATGISGTSIGGGSSSIGGGTSGSTGVSGGGDSSPGGGCGTSGALPTTTPNTTTTGGDSTSNLAALAALSGYGASSSSPFDISKGFLESTPELLVNKPVEKKKSQDDLDQEKLQQIFSGLDPSLQQVIQERTFAKGGTTSGMEFSCETSKSFVPCSTDVLKAIAAKRRSPLTLALLKHMSPNISTMGNITGMARGGLPQKYQDAAPKGHNPEFVTGLTGFYACGRGTGQSDCIPAMLHDGDYVMDAEAVSALGDGSSKAGRAVLDKFHHQVPHHASAGGKVVPAQIADGEYVFPAGFVTALGGGDNKRGAEILDGLREKLRNHKRSAPTSKIPPKAKSPLDYLKMAKG